MPKAGTNKIHFHFLVSSFHFSNRLRLKSFLINQLEKDGKKIGAINYIFCDDQYLLTINQEFLQHKTYTDIITFELSSKTQALIADIYISVERVKENARLFNCSFKAELHRVIFHGILHLLGHKDKTARQSKKMRQLEDLWLRQYFVPRETTIKD